MSKLMNLKALAWGVLLFGVYVLAISLVPRVLLITLLNGIFLGVIVAVVIVYAPLMWLAFWRSKVDRVSQFALGIGLICLSVTGQKIWWIVWHANGAPEAWRNSVFTVAFAYIAIIGGALFVTAPGYPPEDSLEHVELWGANRRLLLTLGAIGGTLTCALSFYTGNAF